MIPLPESRFMQICWVVPDIHAAMAHWSQVAGVGPFFYFESLTWDDARYRGKPWDGAAISAAIAQAGAMQIELVMQHDQRPSMFRELVPEGRSGLHHMALTCENYDADVAHYRRAGCEVVFEGLMMGNRVCWMDTVPQLGFMVELFEASSMASRVFEMFRNAARDWDGTDPVRTLA